MPYTNIAQQSPESKQRSRRSGHHPDPPPQKPSSSGNKRPKMRWLGGILLGGCIIAGGYGFMHWEMFTIQTIEISTPSPSPHTQEIQAKSRQVIEQHSSWWYNGNHTLFAPTWIIKSKLKQKFPFIEKVTFERTFPDTLTVSITPHTPQLITCRQQCFTINEQGKALERVSREKNIPLLRIHHREAIEPGDQVFSAREVRWFTSIEKIYKQIEGFDIKIIRVISQGPDQIFTIYAYTQKGYYLKLDFETNLNQQAHTLKVLFDQELSPEDRQNLHYIDLRIPYRAYYVTHTYDRNDSQN